jgi:hypothetical protein
MRKIFVLTVVSALLTVAALAQPDRPDPRAGEYKAWMQSVQPAMRSLNANINAKAGDMAAADADKLDATFKQVEDFWGQRNVQDAVAFTQTARKALAAIAKDAKAGNTDAALAGVKTLQSTCGGCHTAHRDGAPGSFTIK